MLNEEYVAVPKHLQRCLGLLFGRVNERAFSLKGFNIHSPAQAPLPAWEDYHVY